MEKRFQERNYKSEKGVGKLRDIRFILLNGTNRREILGKKLQGSERSGTLRDKRVIF